MARRVAIVVTTIFEPAFLAGYLASLRDFCHTGATTLYVIADRKTPPSVHEAARQARAQGYDVRCPALQDQESFLEGIGLPGDFVPWDTDNRRNVGFLMALADGCELLVSIDDDNFCPSGLDFIGEHSLVGRPVSGATGARCALLEAPHGGAPRFFNACQLLETEPAVEIFPRGFPYAERRCDSWALETAEVAVRDGAGALIAVNTGLWLADPDVDAVTRLSLAPRAMRFKGPSVLLGPGVWTPVNTQNTALMREAARAYYYVRMGFPVQGMSIDRYGDILSGYFVQKCAKHLGHLVRVGTPIAEHRRTPHNLFKDLYHELAGIVLVEELLPWLVEERLEGSTYTEAYASLSERLAAAAECFHGFVWDQGGREFLIQVSGCMDRWLGAVQGLG